MPEDGVLQPPSVFFSSEDLKVALTINTSAKSEEPFQGATSETCLWMHFYINPEIFMLFVKYSCEPVCKLVPGGKVRRNWRDPTHSANNILSCANVAGMRDTWGDTNDLPCRDKQEAGTGLVRQPASEWLFSHRATDLCSICSTDWQVIKIELSLTLIRAGDHINNFHKK